jgi:hypothetical protein
MDIKHNNIVLLYNIMSGGYNPKVSNPNMSNSIPQMRSWKNQTPFFFGGAQTPTALGLPEGSFNGSGLGLGLDKRGIGSYDPVAKLYRTGEMITNKRGGMIMKKHIKPKVSGSSVY